MLRRASRDMSCVYRWTKTFIGGFGKRGEMDYQSISRAVNALRDSCGLVNCGGDFESGTAPDASIVLSIAVMTYCCITWNSDLVRGGSESCRTARLTPWLLATISQWPDFSIQKNVTKV